MVKDVGLDHLFVVGSPRDGAALAGLDENDREGVMEQGVAALTGSAFGFVNEVGVHRAGDVATAGALPVVGGKDRVLRALPHDEFELARPLGAADVLVQNLSLIHI